MTTSIKAEEKKERTKSNAEAIAAYVLGERIEVKYPGEEWREFYGTICDALFESDIHRLLAHMREGAQFRPKPAPEPAATEIYEETQRAIERQKDVVRSIDNGVEVLLNGVEWMPVSWGTLPSAMEHNARNHGTRYRIKPKPVSLYWNRPEDVPGPVCWLTTEGAATALFLIGRTPGGVYVVGRKAIIEWSELALFWKHSTDRKTWKACRVEEEAK